MVNLKEQVGIKAAEFVKDGMIVGLGTGSTAYYFVAELGRRIKEEGLKITAVTTSSVTYYQAESLGIPLKAIDDVEVVDVTVDGADEVDRMPFFSSTSRILFCGYSVCRNTDAGSKGKRAARHGGVSMSISSCFSGRK